MYSVGLLATQAKSSVIYLLIETGVFVQDP